MGEDNEQGALRTSQNDGSTRGELLSMDAGIQEREEIMVLNFETLAGAPKAPRTSQVRGAFGAFLSIHHFPAHKRACPGVARRFKKCRRLTYFHELSVQH